jgi:hypothetical protein
MDYLRDSTGIVDAISIANKLQRILGVTGNISYSLDLRGDSPWCTFKRDSTVFWLVDLTWDRAQLVARIL